MSEDQAITVLAAESSIRWEKSISVKFQSLRDGVVLPRRGSLDSAGYDLIALEDMTIPPNTTAKIPLGFATEIPEGFHVRIESRSGMALKGAVVLTGVIDADYRGEWSVILRNVNGSHLEIAAGDRVAQAVVRQSFGVSFRVVEELSDSQRGSGGFGSTGR